MKKRDNILRLKYRLEEIARGKYKFEILFMDESLRNLNPGTNKRIYTNEKYHVVSCAAPAISRNPVQNRDIIWLRGSVKSCDNDIFIYYGKLDTDEFHKALEEMVKKVFGNCTVVK